MYAWNSEVKNVFVGSLSSLSYHYFFDTSEVPLSRNARSVIQRKAPDQSKHFSAANFLDLPDLSNILFSTKFHPSNSLHHAIESVAGNVVRMSATASRILLRRPQPHLVVRRSTLRHASTTERATQAASETASKAKGTASNATSKASEGLSRVTSSASSTMSRVGSGISSTLGKIGGRTGRLIGFAECKCCAV